MKITTFPDICLFYVSKHEVKLNMNNWIRKGWENQAVGLTPLLLFLLLDYYFSYRQSFIVSVLFCVSSIMIFHILRKDKTYAFMLLPATLTFILYSIFLIFIQIESLFVSYTPLIVEILFVFVLILMKGTKKRLIRKIKNSDLPVYQRTHSITVLNEFYYVSQITQNVYTLHLFIVIFYNIISGLMQSQGWTRFLYRDLGLIIGILVIIYEQVRLMLIQGRLRKEMWLPVLNEQGNVIGSIAYSVSRLLPKKYYHPIVRIALVHKGMLYLSKRNAHSCVSASLLDYPLYHYVLFRQSVEESVQQTISKLVPQVKPIKPRLLVRYVFENERVKHQVSLFVACIYDESVFKSLKNKNGKLWSIHQIEANLGTGVFSEYFEKEFSYMKSTVLLAETFCN